MEAKIGKRAEAICISQKKQPADHPQKVSRKKYGFRGRGAQNTSKINHTLCTELLLPSPQELDRSFTKTPEKVAMHWSNTTAAKKAVSMAASALYY